MRDTLDALDCGELLGDDWDLHGLDGNIDFAGLGMDDERRTRRASMWCSGSCAAASEARPRARRSIKNCLFFSDQMYRRFNKNDTHGDQMQEKHSV